MKITYTGRQVELAPAQQKKLEAHFTKVGKLLDGKREHEAHVVLSMERRLHRAEVTVNYHDHALVGLAENADLFTSIHDAVAKMEKQAIKVRNKWRDTKRTGRAKAAAIAVTPEPASANGSRRIHHSRISGEKPMTLEEALMVIEKNRDYVIYRSAETDTLSILLRRRDGDFDLVEV